MKNKNYVPAFTSLTEDNKHILIWDFDTGTLKEIMKELKKIQLKYKLGDILIIKTMNGFNAVCLDKFDIYKAFEIKENTPISDINHNIIGFRFDKWALRMGEDKKLLTVLIGSNNREKSLAHAIILKAWFNYSAHGNNFDNCSKIDAESYPSYEHIAPLGVKC